MNNSPIFSKIFNLCQYHLPKIAFQASSIMLASVMPLVSLQTSSIAQTYSDLDLGGSGNSGQRRATAGSRGCGRGLARALVPDTNTAITVSSHPSLWVYVPYSAEDVHAIEVTIGDRNAGRYIYETRVVSANHTPGIIGLHTPTDRPALNLNTDYTWQIRIVCNDPESQRPVDGDYMEGVLQRVTNQSTWYDAMSNSGRSSCSTGSNGANWSSLLSMIGYSDIASQKVVACHTNPHASLLD